MKNFLSIILAAAILACPLCSFATEAAQTLNWYFCDEDEYCDPWIYNYKGEIVLGENEIKFTEDEYCDYYTFNAENDGYYYVECNDKEIDWLAFPEVIKNGEAYRTAYSYYVSETDTEYKMIFELEAGETFFGIDFNGWADKEDTYEIKIEYLGNTVTDIILDENVFDNLLINIDLYNSDASYVLTDVDVVFSGEKTVTFFDEYVQINPQSYPWVNGENNATIMFMDFEKEVVVTACELTDLITDVEFVNLDEYQNIRTHYSDDYYKDIYGAELIFTLANGEKIDIDTNYDEYLKINSRNYYVYAAYTFHDAENVDIVVSVGGHYLKTYECSVTKSSYIESSKDLAQDIVLNIKYAIYYSRLALSELLRFFDMSDIKYAINEAFGYLEYSASHISECIYLIKTFFNYYF